MSSQDFSGSRSVPNLTSDREYEAIIASLRMAVSAQKATVADLRDSVKELQTMNANQKVLIKDQKVAEAGLRLEVGSLDKTLKEALEQNEALEKQNEALEKQNEALEKQKESQGKTIEALCNHTCGLQRTVEKKTEYARTLRNEVVKLEGDLCVQSRNVIALGNERTSLRNTLETSARRANGLQRDLNSKREMNDNQYALLKGLRAERDDLRTQVGVLQSKEWEIPADLKIFGLTIPEIKDLIVLAAAGSSISPPSWKVLFERSQRKASRLSHVLSLAVIHLKACTKIYDEIDYRNSAAANRRVLERIQKERSADA